MWDRYIIAANLEEALIELEKHEGNSRIISGGTDLVLEFEQGLRSGIHTLIDISRVPGLDAIDQDKNGTIHIGPCVTHNQVLRSEILRQSAMCLVMACSEVGSPQIRNRGTVVGNIVTASPANDTIPALVVLGAEVVLLSLKGERVIPVIDFITGVRKTQLAPAEIVKEIRIAGRNTGAVSTFQKLGLRKAQAISVVNCAMWFTLDGKKVKECRISAGSVTPRPNRLTSLENHLIGVEIDKIPSSIESLIIEEISPISDLRGSDEYRREMVKSLIKRGAIDIQSPEKVNRFESPVTLEGVRKDAESIQTTVEFGDTALIETTINGQPYLLKVSPDKSLLDLIREDAHLTGTKEGCGEGECGACTVYLDGKAVMACLVPAPRAQFASIVTIEGISTPELLHPVQQAFVKEGAVQCGYCTPGFVMSAVKLLEEKSNPSQSEIKTAISGNLCRCTGYYKIISAIEKTASEKGG